MYQQSMVQRSIPKWFCTLCLNGVEEGELVLVESLESGVPERSNRKWLQV